MAEQDEGTKKDDAQAEDAGQKKPDEKKPEAAGDKSNLVDEKIKLRKRAQDAEKRVTELEGTVGDLQKQLDGVMTEKDDLTGKVKAFEFRDLRIAAINKAVAALPEGHVVSDPVKLLKYAEDKKDAATLEKDIAELVADFSGPAPADSGAKAPAWAGVHVVNIGGIKPKDSASNNGVPRFDPLDIHGMAQLRKTNPAAYDEALKRWQAEQARKN